jgi:hypothetical protein
MRLNRSPASSRPDRTAEARVSSSRRSLRIDGIRGWMADSARALSRRLVRVGTVTHRETARAAARPAAAVAQRSPRLPHAKPRTVPRDE